MLKALPLLFAVAALPGLLHADFFPVRPDFCRQIHARNPATEAVFMGTVVSETPLRLRVDESFMGLAAGATEEFVWQEAGACSHPVTFGRGRQYLVRVYQDAGGHWTIPSCSHSAEVSEKLTHDMRGLRAWARGERVLHGAVLDNTRRPSLPPGHSADAPDLPIRLTGDNGFDRLVRTGPQGLFHFDGLPPGKYQLRFAEPGWSGSSTNDKLTQEIELTRQACLDTYFAVVENSSTIRGRLAGANVAGLVVEAEPILSPGQELYTRPRRATASANGEFTIEKVPPGIYRLVLNPDGKLTPKTSPYPRTSLARPVRASRGEPVDIGEWPLPPLIKERAARGVVRWTNGKPVPGFVAFTVWGMPGVNYELIVAAWNPAGHGIARSEGVQLSPSREGIVAVTLEQIDKPEWLSLRPALPRPPQ